MTSLRSFRPIDLLKTSLTNLDPLTENYDISFYMQYLAVWPDLFTAAVDREDNIIGYSLSLFPLVLPFPTTLSHKAPYSNLNIPIP